MPHDKFELIVVDDNSTEDIKAVLAPYRGQFPIRYIRYDHTLSPIYQELNPPGTDPQDEIWYHTQALSANIGINKAVGEVICIAQPEIIHNPTSFTHGFDVAMTNKQGFAEIVWGTQVFNQYLTDHPWEELGFDQLHEIALSSGVEYQPNHMPDNGHYEMYWYVEYFPRGIARLVNGVDLRYQTGVYAEDDQFKMRARMAGAEDVWVGRPRAQGTTDGYCVGLHQSHSHEKGKYKKQNRDGVMWNIGANRNRDLFRDFQIHPYMVANEDLPYSPWGEFMITEEVAL